MIILETERLYLRTLEDQDVIPFAAYRSKNEVKKYQSWKDYTIEDATRRIEECRHIDKLNYIGSNYHLAIILKENNQLIGDLFIDVLYHDGFSLGYTLDSQYWRKGYAYEIVSAFLNHMKHLGFETVYCFAYTKNRRSIKLLKKLGFIRFEKNIFYGDEGYEKQL